MIVSKLIIVVIPPLYNSVSVSLGSFSYTIFITGFLSEKMLTGCRPGYFNCKALTLYVKVPEFNSRSGHIFHSVVKKAF